LVGAGFGWREARASFEHAMRHENRVERLVARSDPVAAEKRLQQRLLIAKLEAVPFKGCTGGVLGWQGAGGVRGGLYGRLASPVGSARCSPGNLVC
jgi:hypothetical protein